MGYPGRTEPRAAGGSRRKARPGRRSPASPRPPRPSARSTLRRGRWRLRDSYLPTPRRALRDSTRRRSEACRATRPQHLGQRDADTDLVPSRPTTQGRRRRECFSLPHPLQEPHLCACALLGSEPRPKGAPEVAERLCSRLESCARTLSKERSAAGLRRRLTPQLN